MATSTDQFLALVNTQVGISWIWVLGIIGALFIFALATGLLKRAIKAVLRHARGMANV